MKQNDEHKWIIQASSSLNFSPRFLEAFSNQLADLVKNAINLDPRIGFLVFFRNNRWDDETGSYKNYEPGELPIFDENNVAYLNVDFDGPDNYGHLARIAWRCEAHPGERIFPDNPLNPEDKHDIKVWWAHLPIDEIKAAYLTPPPPHIPETGNLSFDIEWLPWWDAVLPDLNIFLKVSNPLSEEELRQINEELWHVLMNQDEKYLKEVIDWITSRTFSGQTFSVEEVKGMVRNAFVKSSSGIVRKYGNVYWLGLDFLLACDATVAYWIKGLDQISDQLSLEIVKVGSLIERFD